MTLGSWLYPFGVTHFSVALCCPGPPGIMNTTTRKTTIGKGRMRLPGVEPRAQAREACMLPLHYRRSQARFVSPRLNSTCPCTASCHAVDCDSCFAQFLFPLMDSPVLAGSLFAYAGRALGPQGDFLDNVLVATRMTATRELRQFRLTRESRETRVILAKRMTDSQHSPRAQASSPTCGMIFHV